MVLWKLQVVLAIETVVDALDVVVLRPALHHFLRTTVFHATEVLLTCELDVHDELAEALVHLVDGYRVVLVPLLPVAHDNEGHAHVDAR